MTIVQKLRERLCNDSVVRGHHEQPFLGFTRQFGPRFQRRVPEQGGYLVVIHSHVLILSLQFLLVFGCADRARSAKATISWRAANGSFVTASTLAEQTHRSAAAH
jgi:hypothetical protein